MGMLSEFREQRKRERYQKSLTEEQRIEMLNRIVEETSNIVFLGGAGVSTESGIPDFRSKNGL